jgi:intein/homing endonuclease
MEKKQEYIIKVTRTVIDSDTWKVEATSIEEAEEKAKALADSMAYCQSGNVEFEAEEVDE